MPILEKLSKYKHVPLAIIFKGADALGVELANLLIEQGAFVILIDEYSQKNKRKVASLLDNDLFTFLDISGTSSVADALPRVDYIFFLNHRIVDGGEEVATSEFLERSNRLDRLLQLGVEKKSKFLLVSSIAVHRIFQAKRESYADVSVSDDNLSYTVLEVQRYVENLTWEYYKRGGLDARIVRVGELLGEGIDLEADTILNNFVKSAIEGRKLRIEGDGLENMYFVYVLDAAYGLVKACFTPKTSGKIYSIAISRDITVLNLAYKILDLEPKAGGIDFVDKKKSAELEIYKPAPNLSGIGWKEKVSFERALAQTIDYAYKAIGKKKIAKEDGDKKLSVLKAEERLRKRAGERGKKRRSLKDFLINFFFEVKEPSQKRSVLDSVQYAQRKGEVAGKERPSSKSPGSFSSRKAKPKFSRLKIIKWKILDLFTGIKNVIKSLTLPQFFAYLFICIVAISIYMVFIVPIARVVYYGGVAYIRTNMAVEAFENWQFSKTSSNLSRVSFALERVDESLQSISFLENLKAFEFISSLQEEADSLDNGLKGARVVSDILSPVEDYVNNYQSNVSLEGDDSLIVQEREPYNLDSLADISNDLERADELLSGLDTFPESYDSSLPLGDKLMANFLEKARRLQSYSRGAMDIVRIVPVLLGVNKSQTYVVLLLDNNKITAQGGEIVAICVLSVGKGRVTKIQMYDPVDLDVNLSSEQERFVRDDLKLLYPEDGLEFKDLSLIGSDDTFAALVKASVEVEFGGASDHVVTLDLVAINQLLVRFGSVSLSDEGTLNTTNFDEKMLDESVSKREILAKLLQHLFEFEKEDLEALVVLFEGNIRGKNIQVNFDNLTVQEFLVDKSILIQESSLASEEIDISFTSDSNLLPQIELESKIDVFDSNTEGEYVVSFEKDPEGGFEGIGVIRFGENFNISNVTVSSSQIELASSYANKVYLNFKLEEVGKEEVVIKGTNSNVVRKDEDRYNYVIQLHKPNGFSYGYEVVLTYEDDLSLIFSPSESIKLETAVKMTGNLMKDEMWEFVFDGEEI